MKSVRRPKQGTEAASIKRTKSERQVPKVSECNGTALRKATRRVSQLYDVVLAPSGIRATQLSILTEIARANEPNIGELAKALVLDRSALARNLKPLERDGFVDVMIDKYDRRTRLVALTDAGRTKLLETLPFWDRAQHSFATVVGSDRAGKMRELLKFVSSEEFARAFERELRIKN